MDYCACTFPFSKCLPVGNFPWNSEKEISGTGKLLIINNNNNNNNNNSKRE
jgi:hypothetical protein